MASSPFFAPSAWRGTHSRSTPKPAPKAQGSRIAPAYIAGGTLILLAGCLTEAVLSLIEGHWASAGACVVSFGLTLVFYGMAFRMSVRREREQEAARVIRDAEARRQAIKAQIAEMHENDSRRGRLQQQLERNMLVVLSGGRS